jgi:hypothetical protein
MARLNAGMDRISGRRTNLLLLLTPARGSATCLMTRITATESMHPLVTANSISTDGVLRRGISAIIPEATGSEGANATSFIRIRTVTVQAGLQVHRTSVHTQFYTLTHRTRHHRTPTSLILHQQLYLLDTDPPIANDRPPAHPDRIDSISLPASLRPAAPPACRPNCPGRLAWTRQLLGRTAYRLHAAEPCHAGFHGTRQKYFKENSNKKTPIFGCSNASEEPVGYVRTSAPRMAPALFCSFGTSFGPSSRAPSRTSSGASSVQQQIAPPLARAGCRTAIRGFHA